METAPCQEVITEDVNLYDLPVLLHLPADAGHYIASNVVIIQDPDLGRNMCYHRLLRLDEKRFAARIVENRGNPYGPQKNGRRSTGGYLHRRLPGDPFGGFDVAAARGG
ncbi:MAG: UbiD family decarboxylase [Chloroflexi bacterium]|nr:UbiD family decarboxylase [Chloroflexota bacterium]